MSRLTDLLALSVVPRWSIVDCVRTQSVAEHTFRVCAIVLELGERLGMLRDVIHGALRLALTHDGAESRSADIPRPFKQALRDVGVTPIMLALAEYRMCPWSGDEPLLSSSARDLVRLADLIECYTFIEVYGHGPTAKKVAEHCQIEVLSAIAPLEPAQRWAVSNIVGDILGDKGRWPILTEVDEAKQ